VVGCILSKDIKDITVHNTLQQAFDAAVAGDIIGVCPGLTLNLGSYRLTKRIHICSYSVGTTQPPEKYSPCSDFSESNFGWTQPDQITLGKKPEAQSSSVIMIDTLTFDSGSNGSSFSGSIVLRCSQLDSPTSGGGIVINTGNITVEGLQFQQCTSAVQVLDGADSQVINNQIYVLGWVNYERYLTKDIKGIVVGAKVTSLSVSDNIIILGSTGISNMVAISVADGSTNVVIEQNCISEFNTNPLRCAHESLNTTGILVDSSTATISSNRISSFYNGIVLTNQIGRWTTVASNQIDGIVNVGIWIKQSSNNYVINNCITGTGSSCINPGSGYGIKIDIGSLVNVVRGNSIRESCSALWNNQICHIWSVQNRVDDNVIIENNLIGCNETCGVCICVNSTEICDYLDNDCDGFVDENFPELNTKCFGEFGVGVWECSSEGGLVCNTEIAGTGDLAKVNTVCGDGVCHPTEIRDDGRTNCPQDCAICGDEYCTIGEETTCETDCGNHTRCGDGKCDPVEIQFGMTTCPEDCTRCGDGYCHIGEENSCPIDCGNHTLCGDGICDISEFTWSGYTTCSIDCIICGDNVCHPGEFCPGDCAMCGDRICTDGQESYDSCLKDCPLCGDGICLGENYLTCAMDCLPPVVLNGICDAFETFWTAPLDCGCTDGVCQSTRTGGPEDEFTCPEDCSSCEMEFVVTVNLIQI